jgi:hypothetical protein
MLYSGIRKAVRSKIKLVLILVFLIPVFSFSQQEKEFVFGTFRSTQLINVQTTEMILPKSFEFSIRHRFGMLSMNNMLVKQLLGLDLPANIRFGFIFPVTKKINVGVGRSKNEKTFDGEIKILLMQQTEDNTWPFSVAAYSNVAVRSNDFPNVSEYAYFNDGITPFRYKFNHRISYCSELIVARKFSEKFSLEIISSYVYKNLVSPGNENKTWSVPVGLTYKTGLHSSFILEYAYRFNNRPVGKDYPLSVGWEIGTSGHIFQIVATSTGELVEEEIYSKTGYNYLKKNFALGFNIRRTFWKKTAKK